MPEGRVVVSLRDKRASQEISGRVEMSVKRTTLREPPYVRKIVHRLAGAPTHEETKTIEGLLDQHLNGASEERPFRLRTYVKGIFQRLKGGYSNTTAQRIVEMADQRFNRDAPVRDDELPPLFGGRGNEPW